MVRFSLVIVLYLFVVLKVCSAVEPTVSKRTQKCQEYSAHVYGQGVKPTCEISSDSNQLIDIQEFPHIVIMAQRDDDDEQYRWTCHGTLVSSRYILSIAHCIRGSQMKPDKVRLGAMTSKFSDDSISTDYDVEQIILHPLYKSSLHYNDIGLIKLARKVEFSENVRPICLPDSDIMPSTLYQVNYKSTEGENLVQRPLSKSIHRPVTQQQCNEISFYQPGASRKLREGITDQQMCHARETIVSANYTCRGESGAPLYIDHPQVACSHIQLGIESFGVLCGNEVPDVATKVFSFADWIESVIWADDEDF